MPLNQPTKFSEPQVFGPTYFKRLFSLPKVLACARASLGRGVESFAVVRAAPDFSPIAIIPASERAHSIRTPRKCSRRKKHNRAPPSRTMPRLRGKGLDHERTWKMQTSDTSVRLPPRQRTRVFFQLRLAWLDGKFLDTFPR